MLYPNSKEEWIYLVDSCKNWSLVIHNDSYMPLSERVIILGCSFKNFFDFINSEWATEEFCVWFFTWFVIILVQLPIICSILNFGPRDKN